MGIQGLLPLLKSIHRPCNIQKFSGQTIGVDAYVWLHRGTVACAAELALDKPTRKFVDFALNRVRMLQHFGVTPFLVFDGDYLPSKAATEAGRAHRREESRRLGLELLKLGKTAQAQIELQKAVDVTPAMAGQLIDELKRTGVKFIVAPYEADAQLTYLERKGVISGIISEDSDLLVFGAKCLITKLDQYGDCIEINRADFTACKEISLVGWSDAEFRWMAILSGCDYLVNMNRMGLKTAYRLVRKYKSVERIVKAIQFDGQFKVPAGYLASFRQAELTFLHQWVFCPLSNNLVMHTEPDDDVDHDKLLGIGSHIDSSVAAGVACGDLHPVTKEPLIRREPREKGVATPWRKGVNLQQAISTGGENLKSGKPGKPIDDFFKVKRVPLAELDPNSLTPSPSQRGVLQRYSNASWPARPTPPRRAVTSPGIATPTRNGLGQHSSPMISENVLRSRPNNSIRQPKRARLCSDQLELALPSNKEDSEPVRSRFFESPATPALETTSKKKKNKRATFNIFSDDSIEEAMSQMADDTVTAKPSSLGSTGPVRELRDKDYNSNLPSSVIMVEKESLKKGETFIQLKGRSRGDAPLVKENQMTTETSSMTPLDNDSRKGLTRSRFRQTTSIMSADPNASATMSRDSTILTAEDTTKATSTVTNSLILNIQDTDKSVTATFTASGHGRGDISVNGSEDLMIPDTDDEVDNRELSD